jgi:Domain of unknown function (DUF4277)
MAAVIEDCGLMGMIHARLVPDAPDVITPGDAMAGLILHGRGLANRPLSWIPPCCATTPLERWWREGLEAELFNRLMLGRTLDEASPSGGDLWLQELALAGWAQDGMDRRGNPRATTSVARSGAYVPDRDAQAVTLPHGSARAHRPDLPPAVVALRGAQDGGGLLGSNRGDGHTSDRAVFQARAQAGRAAVQNAPSPRALIAAAPRDPEDTAPTLHTLGLLTRSPHTSGAVAPGVAHALAWDPWHRLEDNTPEQGMAFCPDGRAQRGLVVHAQAALERAAVTRTNARQRDEAALARPRLPLHAQRGKTPAGAQDALPAWTQRWTYPQVASSPGIAHRREAGTGRLPPRTPLPASAGHIQARGRPAQAVLGHPQRVKAGVVRGTPIGASALRAPAVMATSPGQACGERGGRGCQAPRFWVASGLGQQPRCMEGLGRVRPRTGWVASVAPRRLRQHWARQHATVPHHLHPPTTLPP